jgi:hypothetical protein
VLGRYKADRELGRLPTCTYSRIKADIGDLVLQDVPEVAGADGSVVGVGKHLCGAATDFALRCLQAAVASGRVKARGESGAMAHFDISSRRSYLRAQRCGAGRHAPDARRRVATPRRSPFSTLLVWFGSRAGPLLARSGHRHMLPPPLCLGPVLLSGEAYHSFIPFALEGMGDSLTRS